MLALRAADGGGPGSGPSQVELNKALVIQACRWRITGRDRAAEAEKSMADREAGEATAAYELVQLEKQLNAEKVAAARRAASTAVKRAAEADRALSAANRMKVRMELREHQAASGFTLADMIRLILDGEMREVCAQTFDTDLPHTRIDHADTARTPHVGLACVRYITAICPYAWLTHIHTLSFALVAGALVRWARTAKGWWSTICAFTLRSVSALAIGAHRGSLLRASARLILMAMARCASTSCGSGFEGHATLSTGGSIA